jgi:hypothetical protein
MQPEWAKRGEETVVILAAFPLDLPKTKNIPTFTAELGTNTITDLSEGEG